MKDKNKFFTDVTTINKDGVYEIPFSGLKPNNPPGLLPLDGQAQGTDTQTSSSPIASNTGKGIKKTN